MDNNVHEKINRLEGMVGKLTLIWNQYLVSRGASQGDLVVQCKFSDLNFDEQEKISYLEDIVENLTIQCSQCLVSQKDSGCLVEQPKQLPAVANNNSVKQLQLREQDVFQETVTDNLEVHEQNQFRPQTQLTIMRHFTTFISRHSLLSSNTNLELIELFRKYAETKGRIHKDRLDFYFACEGLKQQTDPTVISRIALSIYRFLLKSKIRVTEGVRRAINNLLRTESLNTDVFDRTQEVVGNVIFATTYKSFLDTEMYLDFLDRSSEVSSVSEPISLIPHIEVEIEVEFVANLKVSLYRRLMFLVIYCGNYGCAEVGRYVTIGYIRDRHMEWEIAWKKNYDLDQA